MKVVILAGGYGTRLSEYTHNIPKPMIEINNKPLIHHIMDLYSNYGHKEFYLALGYKKEIIKEYFLNLKSNQTDFTIDYSSNQISYSTKSKIDWKVHLVDTGEGTLTGGRLKKIMKLIKDDDFLLTYGDGLSNVDINALIKFHLDKKSLISVTAVRPQARFGEIKLNSDGLVSQFKEKPQLHEGWINGGFFVVNKKFFSNLKLRNPVLEREPLENASKNGKLYAFKHHGFWQCVDSKRDLDLLRELSKQNVPPWIKK